jgi:cytochrome c
MYELDPRQTCWTCHASAGVIKVAAAVTKLAAEFPDYEFATHPTFDGTSIIARRHGGCTRPGLYAVVTGDPDEMRRTLLESEGSRLPGG